MEKKYTYVDFAQEVIALVSEMDIEKAVADRVIDKAQALLATQLKKAEYSATHPKKSTAKGAGEKTLALVAELKTVLNATPMTSAEIAKALGKELNPLQISNAIKYIDGVKSEKVVRATKNSKGLTAEKLYTAYSIQ